tara:strand:+ start:1312 stop:1452 length:141 start_codon:yes stop_codon:yes gene_type:complete
MLLLGGCATSNLTEEQKEDRKKLTVIRAVGCVVIPALPVCIVPSGK